MPKHEKYVPRHRQTRSSAGAAKTTRRVLRTTVVCSSVAVAATAGVVSSGVAASPMTAGNQALNDRAWTDREQNTGASADPSALIADEATERAQVVSRSARREAANAAKEPERSPGDGAAVTRPDPLRNADPRVIAMRLLPQYGYAQDQFGCLDALYQSESGWRIDADNPTSSAYGIPQALTSMHDLPPDYTVSAEAQIRWGLGYIRDSYGSPCSAWTFKQGNNWY